MGISAQSSAHVRPLRTPSRRAERMAMQMSPPIPQASHWRELQPPALVIEILSPSTRNTDRHRKRPAYLAHGVAEVWLVDIDAKSLERWTAQSEFPQLHNTRITLAPSDETSQLSIDIAALFD